MNLHLGIDARTLQDEESLARGIGQYTHHHMLAVRALRPQWTLTLYVDPGPCPPEIEALAGAGPGGIAPVDGFAPADVDVLHIPDPLNLHTGFDSPFRLFRGCPLTATFYDMTIFDHYLSSWPERQRRANLLRLEQLKASGATLLAISRFTGRECRHRLGLDPSRVAVVMAGLNAGPGSGPPRAEDVSRVRESLGLSGPYFLHVGALDPHKNFETVLRAFLALRASVPEAALVVVGRREGWLSAQAGRVREQGIAGVAFPGFLPREDLECLYADAAGLVCLSRSEGFGLPVLEAMAQGCPVVCSRSGALPEVAAEAAALVDADDYRGAAQAMARLIRDPSWREGLVRAGRERAGRFTWHAVAERSASVWEGMVVSGGA